MNWIACAIGAAIFYGLHQIFTKLASRGIGDGIGGFVVEVTAAVTIGLYLVFLRYSGRWNQSFTSSGFSYSVLTGLCVGIGTILFFQLFQRGGPLSSVPAILAGGAAIMAVTGILFFKESVQPLKILGIVLSISGLFLLR
jgi:transporter family protein